MKRLAALVLLLVSVVATCLFGARSLADEWDSLEKRND